MVVGIIIAVIVVLIVLGPSAPTTGWSRYAIV